MPRSQESCQCLDAQGGLKVSICSSGEMLLLGCLPRII
jgi:hypothetical protein